MTNSQTLGTIEATNPVLAVAPLKEETEMLRATDKITALYCRLSVEDMNKNGGKEDESNSIQNQELICKGWFLPPNTYDCGSFVVNRTAIRGHHAREAFPYYAAQRQAGNISTARRGCGESAGAADDHAAKEYGAT